MQNERRLRFAVAEALSPSRFAMALTQNWVFKQQNGLFSNKIFRRQKDPQLKPWDSSKDEKVPRALSFPLVTDFVFCYG